MEWESSTLPFHHNKPRKALTKPQDTGHGPAAPYSPFLLSWSPIIRATGRLVTEWHFLNPCLFLNKWKANQITRNLLSFIFLVFSYRDGQVPNEKSPSWLLEINHFTADKLVKFRLELVYQRIMSWRVTISITKTRYLLHLFNIDKQEKCMYQGINLKFFVIHWTKSTFVLEALRRGTKQ